MVSPAMSFWPEESSGSKTRLSSSTPTRWGTSSWTAPGARSAGLAKRALLRPLDVPNADPYYAALEQELLEAINATGFGPQGFGGANTCLGVAIEQMPTHVACLPVAVNMSCHVTRRASAAL